MLVDGKFITTELHHIVYVPRVSNCLFSTGVIEQKGHTLIQGGGRMSIYSRLLSSMPKSGSTITVGDKLLEAKYVEQSNVYVFVLEVPGTSHAEASIHNVTDYKTWHQHCGYPSEEALKHLSEHSKGVNHIDSKPKDSEVCGGCKFGKSHHLPFPLSEKCATQPLKLIHTDEDGPMHTQSIQGFRYFVTFVDDYSGLRHMHFLKHKNEAHKLFLEYKAWAENQTGHKIKQIRSDCGMEYTLEAF